MTLQSTSPIEQEEKAWHELDRKVKLIKARGKFVTNEEVVIYIKWRFGKSRTWTYTNILKKLVWYQKPTANKQILRYLTYQDARQQIDRLMG